MANQKMIQTLMSPDYQSLIVCKQFPKSTGLVSPFKKVRNTIISDFPIPKNRQHRLQKMHRAIPQISSYKHINDTTVLFDCIEPVFENTDIFTNGTDNIVATKGVVHLDLMMSHVKGVTYCDINPRILIKEHTEIKKIHSSIPYKMFLTDKIKIFSVMMVKGYMSCVVNRRRSILHMIINQPNNNFVGCCIDKDNNQMIKHIQSVWPIFDISRNKTSLEIRLKDDIVPAPIIKLENGNGIQRKHPILVRIERFLDNDEIVIHYIGESLFIP